MRLVKAELMYLTTSPSLSLADLSNDSFSTGLDGSQHSHSESFITSHSPNPGPGGHSYNSYSENIVYTPMIGEEN